MSRAEDWTKEMAKRRCKFGKVKRGPRKGQCRKQRKARR